MQQLGGLLPGFGYSYRRNTVSLAAGCPLGVCASYPLATRIALNFANSPLSLGGAQTCELPSGSFILAYSNPGYPASTAGSAPSVLEGATREKFFLLSVSILQLGIFGQQAVEIRSQPAKRWLFYRPRSFFRSSWEIHFLFFSLTSRAE
jgi:hypothetical protein